MLIGTPPRASPSRRRGRSRAGGAARGRAARATRRRRPAGRGRRRRAGAACRRGSSSSASIGNESTSVASSIPRCSLLQARGSRPARRTRGRARRRRCPRAASTRRASSTAPSTSTSLAAAVLDLDLDHRLRSVARLLRVQLVRLDDALHELVPHDVLVPEADERDAVDRPEDVLHLDQPRCLLARKVDLGDVARDDDLRAEAEPRQEHLHLLGRGVLRLVEDDEAVVQRTAAHERERCDLDRSALDVRVQLLGIHRVVQRVEERAHVRIDLREHVARQEAEPFAGLDRGPRQDDPAHLPVAAARRRRAPSRGTSCPCPPARCRT